MYSVAQNCQIEGLPSIYESYFGNNYIGNFVEIGAFDGYNYSNTCGLADLGWNGIFVEPHPNSFALLQERYKDYENIKCFQNAIGNLETVDFFLSNAISTASKEQYELYKIHNWANGKENSIKVQKIPFDDFLVAIGYSYSIDVLSIDVEGSELEVLNTFTIDKWNPKMAIVEAHQNHPLESFGRNADEINDYFTSKGYNIIYSDVINNIYVKEVNSV